MASGEPAAFGALWRVPIAIVAAVVVVAGVWLLIVVLASYVPLPLPLTITDPIACQCMGGRFYSLLFNLGDRNVLISDAWRLFTSHPLFGAGLGFSEAGYRYPHNVPLELAAETGLVGALLLLAPLMVGWLRLARAGIRAASPAIASAIMIVVVYAVVANLSGDFPSARGLWVFGLVMLKLGLKADPAEVRG
jgi:O-antigen ligase